MNHSVKRISSVEIIVLCRLPCSLSLICFYKLYFEVYCGVCVLHFRLLLSCAYMAACVLLPMWYMKINGNLKNSYSLSVCLLKNLLPMCVLCIAVSWVLLVMPSNMVKQIKMGMYQFTD